MYLTLTLKQLDENPVTRALQEGLVLNLTDGRTLVAWGGTRVALSENIASAGAHLTLTGLSQPKEARASSLASTETMAKIERAKREWESTVDALPDLICLVDRQGCIIRANRIVEAWKLGQVTRVTGHPLHSLLHPACADLECSLDMLLQHALQQTARGEPVEQEIHDPVLGRFLLVKARPVLARERETGPDTVLLLQDITEHKHSEQEREKLIQDLDAFAHTVAHDLKNPLALVMGFAEELVSNPAQPNEDLQWCLQAIVRHGHKMNNIVDELLLLAGVRQTQVARSVLDMSFVVAEARQRLADMIEERQAEVLLPRAWPQAMGYAPWVEEVWVNYLNNALKYGGQPPRIELGGETQADGLVRFWVRDNGVGIAPEAQACLFIPFTRLDQARATGHGLGLSIVRRIVEKLGGQVGIDSTSLPGSGSTFYFTLPAAPPAR